VYGKVGRRTLTFSFAEMSIPLEMRPSENLHYVIGEKVRRKKAIGLQPGATPARELVRSTRWQSKSDVSQ
jgi:hypothetical protein